MHYNLLPCDECTGSIHMCTDKNWCAKLKTRLTDLQRNEQASGERMETRVKKLETSMSKVHTRLAIVENELEHGEGVFTRIETGIIEMADRLTKHMDREEGKHQKAHEKEVKVRDSLLALTVVIIGGLATYIWNTHL